MHRSFGAMLLTVCSLTLAACGGPEFTAGGRPLPTPEDPGLYALTTDNELRRISGSEEWERKTWPSRSDFAPGTEFIVYEPALAGTPPGDGVDLWRVAWLRSELEPTGQAAPVNGSEWVVAGLEDHRVPLAATPHPEIPGVVHLSPGRRLSPGLYELRTEPPAAPVRSGRIGVLWNSLTKRDYAASHCVDRVVGGEARYQPCTGESMAVASAGSTVSSRTASSMNPVQPRSGALTLELNEPVKERGGLTIRGRVVNASSRMQTLPMLKGTILDASGNPADSWVFAAPENTLPPGGVVAFSTWRPAPPGAARLNVDFVQN